MRHVLGLVMPAQFVTPAALLVCLALLAAVLVGSYVIYRQELRDLQPDSLQ